MPLYLQAGSIWQRRKECHERGADLWWIIKIVCWFGNRELCRFSAPQTFLTGLIHLSQEEVFDISVSDSKLRLNLRTSRRKILLLLVRLSPQ